MARISNIKPPCGYTVEGIAKIWLLDKEDFKGYRFDENGLYGSCLVTDILRVGEFIELDAPDMVARYNGSGSYLHGIESFIKGLASETISNLHLGTKRRQVVVFLTKAGRFHSFGSDAGAVLSYTNQTAESLGSLVNLSAASRYPLYEVTADAMARFVRPVLFRPDFDNGAYCETT